MRIVIVSVGRLSKAPEADLVARYRKRIGALGRAVGVVGVDFVEIADARSRDVDVRRRKEAEAIRARLPAAAVITALDEHGESEPTAAFAQRLRRAIDQGTADLAFVIGGADGLDPSVIQAAQRTMALGPMTFPHQLVRAMLSEQLYRAFTILADHPYHRA